MIAGGPIAVGLCAVTYFVLAPDEVLYRQEIRQGNDLVRNIEKFRQERGHLPGSMDDLPISGVNVESVFYDKCSESHCVVWFGTRLWGVDDLHFGRSKVARC